MSWTRDLLDGIAQELATAGVATYAATYTAGQTGVFFKHLPANPDRAIAITPYFASDDVKTTASAVRVQFSMRGNTNDAMDVDDLADAVFAAIHGMEHKQYGTCHVVQALRVSSIALGNDEARRAERSDNYQFDINTPNTSGRPE